MEFNPLISVITICFNSDKTIERTIRSVLNQTYQDFEYIIIDGKSSDKTLDIIRRYEPLFEGRMKVISEKDSGIYDAMNKGINHANGDLIGIVNSDDYYELDALQNISSHYDGEKYLVFYGMIRTMLGEKEVMIYSKNHEFLENEMITHPSCFITRAVYQDFGMYSLKYKYSADYEFMLRIKKKEVVRFVEVYKIISNFSIDGASSSVRAYRDTLRLRYEYGLISKKDYYFKMTKSWLALKMKR